MAPKRIILKLIVDRSKNQVVLAESDKDFVDILLSFLTLPLGTIVRLTSKKSNIGSMDSLYDGIERLDAQYLSSAAGKSMLLRPINSAAETCSSLLINIDDNHWALPYYACNSGCSHELLSSVPNARCHCQKNMDRKVHLMRTDKPKQEEDIGVYVKGLDRFMITDNWGIVPVSTEAIINLLKRLGIEDKGSLEWREVHADHSDVLRLLKFCFNSKTPLTNVFLKNENMPTGMEIKPKLEAQQPDSTQGNIGMENKPKLEAEQPGNTQQSASKSPTIRIKLLVNKCSKDVLYAEAKQDFVNLLFSFLTYPAGCVAKILNGQSRLGCIDNLFESAVHLSSSDYLTRKEILVDPKLAPNFSLKDQLIEVGEQSPERYYMCRTPDCDSNEVSTIPNVTCKSCEKITNKRLSLVDPMKSTSSGGFVKSATYMITDDLVVSPLSLSVISDYFGRAEEGMEVMMVDLGKEKALGLLRASVTSKKALTCAFASEWSKG